jgi:signal transduction histidine kinase
MYGPDFRRISTGLSGILFFLILFFTYGAMFVVDRRSEKALVDLQHTFVDMYEGIQELRIDSQVLPDGTTGQEKGSLQEETIQDRVDEAGMSAAVGLFRNLSTIQWLPGQESPAIALDEAWQNWLVARTMRHSPENESIQLLRAIKLANAHLEELKLRTTDAFDLIIFLSGVLFSLGTSGSIAFYARLRQSQLKEESAAANLKKALESEDEIRKTIALELHDDIAQDIAAARMLCERMNKTGSSNTDLASRAAITLGEVNQKIRILCTELRPPALEETGLQEAIRALCESEAERHSKPLQFIPSGDIPRMQSQIEANLYRIIREAVVNATKHARDGSIEVRTWVTGMDDSRDSLAIEIKDSGFELEPQTGSHEGTQATTQATTRAGSRGYGFGIAAMQERATFIGAVLSVQLDPAGSLVRIVVPLRQSGRKDQLWQEH